MFLRRQRWLPYARLFGVLPLPVFHMLPFSVCKWGCRRSSRRAIRLGFFMLGPTPESLLADESQVAMHSLWRQPLPELLIHLEQRMGYSMHLRSTNPAIQTEPYNGNEYMLAHALSGSGTGSLSAAPAETWHKQTHERVLCRMHWQGVFSTAALPPM